MSTVSVLQRARVLLHTLLDRVMHTSGITSVILCYTAVTVLTGSVVSKVATAHRRKVK